MDLTMELVSATLVFQNFNVFQTEQVVVQIVLMIMIVRMGLDVRLNATRGRSVW